MEVANKPFKLLTAIINHNQHGIALKKSLSPLVDTILIDSDSTFEDDEKEHFDFTLTNVYYSGLINQAHKAFEREHTRAFDHIRCDNIGL